LVTFDNLTGNRVWASEHLPGEIQLTFPDDLANPGAADHCSSERDWGQRMNVESQVLPERAEQSHIAGTAVAKGKVAAYGDAEDLAKIAGQSADEHLTGLLAERVVEMKEEDDLHPEGADGTQLLVEGTNQGWRSFRCDDGAGVAIKSDGDSHGIVPLSIGDSLEDDALMAQMNAIEHTDGQTNFAVARRQFLSMAYNLHRWGRGGSQAPCGNLR
jgi:hypothetical protein